MESQEAANVVMQVGKKKEKDIQIISNLQEARVYGGSNMRPNDITSTSDPITVATMHGTPFKSRTLTPQWIQTFAFPVAFSSRI
jgi:hypothetical protein